MQNPTNADAILGGESHQVTSAVLGGIEGARRRLALAQTFSDQSEAIRLLSHYSLEEAKLALRQLFKISPNIPLEAFHATNETIQTIANRASSQEIQEAQEQIGQINNDAIQNLKLLTVSIKSDFKRFKMKQKPTQEHPHS
jgi:hypothetical protein